LNVIGLKRSSLVTHFIQYASEGPNIWLIRVWFMIVLFRWHIIWRTDICLSQVPDMIENLADTKITQSNVAFKNENIWWLEIPMQDFLFMHVKNCQRHLCYPVKNFILRKFISLHWLNYLIHIATFTILHNNIQQPFTINKRVSVGHDIDMMELLEQFNLIEDMLFFFFWFIFYINLFDDILFLFRYVQSQVCITKCTFADYFENLVFGHLNILFLNFL